MRDYRNEFLTSIGECLSGVCDLDIVLPLITVVLDKYELTERSTEIVPVDSANDKLIKTYLADCSVNGKKKSTLAGYKREIDKFRHHIGNADLTQVRSFDIKAYLASEKLRGISSCTLENQRSYISAFYAWLTANEIIPRNPCQNIEPIRYNKIKELPFDSVEMDSIRSACKNIKERAIIEFLVASGVRVAEFCNLDIDDIDFNKKTVHVKHGKGDKERYTYLSDLAISHLVKYLTHESNNIGALFKNRYGDRYTPHGVRQLLISIGEKAKVESVHPHRFRKTLASSLAARGMAIQEIQKILGHENINTTMLYIITNDIQVSTSYQRHIA